MRTLVLGGTRSGKSGYAEALLPADAAVRYLATARRYPDDPDWDTRIARHVARRPATWTTVESPDLVAELARPGLLLVDDLATWITGLLDDADAWADPAATIDVSPLVEAVRGFPTEPDGGECPSGAGSSGPGPSGPGPSGVGPSGVGSGRVGPSGAGSSGVLSGGAGPSGAGPSGAGSGGPGLGGSRLVLVSAEVGLGVVPSTRAGRVFRDELGALNAALAQVCDEVVLLVAGLPLWLKGRDPRR